MTFSAVALAKLQAELRTVPGKQAALQQQFLQRPFRDDRAREFAHHGFVRRLKTLARCTERVFEIIPPEQREPPERDNRSDAEVYIQAAVFSAFAAADNLAWIWVVERNVRQPNGNPLPEQWVGLRRTNRAVRNSMPGELREYFAGLDGWFDELEGYRHGLAHRVPLYIPPYVVISENQGRYRDLENGMTRALARGDIVELERLRAAQAELKVFRAWMMHSFYEEAKPLVFHPQLLANFNTIEEMGRKLLEHLDA